MLLDDVTAATEILQPWLPESRPQLAIVLGSGLADLAWQLAERQTIAYDDLPGFPASGVAGHIGQLHSGQLFGRSVLVFQGRYHCYEGYSAWQVTAQVRLAAALGCRQLLLTNAVGGISARLQVGDFMLVSDHMNIGNESPLRGRPEREFLDLGNLYKQDFYISLQERLEREKISLQRGVLAWMLGPTYETPAEIRALERLGADAVTMSTIPEAIVARLCNLQTVALSCITNLASGKHSSSLDHEEVLASGTGATEKFQRLLKQLFEVWLGSE